MGTQSIIIIIVYYYFEFQCIFIRYSGATFVVLFSDFRSTAFARRLPIALQSAQRHDVDTDVTV